MSEQEKIKTNKIPKILRKITSFYPFFFKGAKVFLCPGAKDLAPPIALIF
jgi:hypothetical protein